MATLYIVRHGQTEYNANQIIQGHCDSPLTELGQQQAADTGEKLKDVNFTICYHSPLGRTNHTKDIILKHHNITTVPKDDLKEIFLGTLEGKYFGDEEEAKKFDAFWRTPETYTGEDNAGESYDSLEKRIYECCKEIVSNHNDDENILIVSHGAAIRSFLNPLINKSRSEFWSDPDVTPASISIVKWDREKKPQVISYAGHNYN